MIVKNENDLKNLRESGRILATVLEYLKNEVREGMSTEYLDALARKLILESNAKPAFLNYDGFPATLCTSLNEEIVHGVPSKNVIIKNGDLLKLDLGVNFNRYFTDKAVTVIVGDVSFEEKRLVDVTKKSLKIGIANVRAGKTTGDIGNAIERYIEKQNFGVIRELCGHGVGRTVHEKPDVPNYGFRHEGDILKENMVIAIEPMVSMGNWRVVETKTGSYRTKDNSKTAHFEDTVIVKKDEAEVITSLH